MKRDERGALCLTMVLLLNEEALSSHPHPSPSPPLPPVQEYYSLSPFFRAREKLPNQAVPTSLSCSFTLSTICHTTLSIDRKLACVFLVSLAETSSPSVITFEVLFYCFALRIAPPPTPLYYHLVSVHTFQFYYTVVSTEICPLVDHKFTPIVVAVHFSITHKTNIFKIESQPTESSSQPGARLPPPPLSLCFTTQCART